MLMPNKIVSFFQFKFHVQIIKDFPVFIFIVLTIVVKIIKLIKYDRLLVIKSGRFLIWISFYKSQHKNNKLPRQVSAILKPFMAHFDIINKMTEKNLGRDHTFFSNPGRFRHWSDDRLNFDPSKITDLSLQCVGYGQFYPAQIVDRFITYFKQCTKDMPRLKNLKLKINGFDLKQCPNLITQVCKTIDKMQKGNLKLVELQTTRLMNCDAIRDFGEIIKTTIRLGIKSRQGFFKDDKNCFESLTLQFADWQFMYKQGKSQPDPQTLKNQLGIIEQQAFDSDGYSFKKFRLEMSTWYYTQKESEIFFHSFSVDQFHNSMDSFVRSCYSFMPDLQYFQLDLRNWFSSFQLPKMRDSLMMIPKQGAQNMSINSKNISRIKKKKDERTSAVNELNDDEQDILLFERHIVV